MARFVPQMDGGAEAEQETCRGEVPERTGDVQWVESLEWVGGREGGGGVGRWEGVGGVGGEGGGWAQGVGVGVRREGRAG